MKMCPDPEFYEEAISDMLVNGMTANQTNVTLAQQLAIANLDREAIRDYCTSSSSMPPIITQ